MAAIFSILFYTFVAIVILHILYHILILGKVVYEKKQKPTSNSLPVSVIVYIENNEAELPSFLTALKKQAYSNFQIVLINNASYDSSLEIIESFALNNPNTKVVNVENNEAFWGNKRYALTLGIKVAKFDYLLFAEPTALPDSALWIENMMREFSSKKNIVLGHTHLEVVRKSFWNKLMRFQNIFSTSYNFAWAKINKPLFGNNKNLAYKKEEFFKANGYIHQMQKSHGEDFYFINEISTRTNVAISTNNTSFTTEKTTPSYKKWKNSLKEHIVLFSNLKLIDKLKVYLYTYTRSIYFILLTILLSFLYQWEIVLILFVVRSLIVGIYTYKIFKRFDEKDLIYWFCILEFMHSFMVSFISIKNKISRK